MDERLLWMDWPPPLAFEAPMERKLKRRSPLRAKERAGRACSTTPFSAVPAGSSTGPCGLQRGLTSTAEIASPFFADAELTPAVRRACMVPEVRSTASACGMGGDAEGRRSG